MEKISREQILEIIKAMRKTYLTKYLNADSNNISGELIEQMEYDLTHGLCAVFAIALKLAIPSARFCKFEGIFGGHAFVRIGEDFFDGNGSLLPGDDTFSLWNSDERFFDVYEQDLISLMPKDYYVNREVSIYYDNMIDALVKSGRDVIASYLKNQEKVPMSLQSFKDKIFSIKWLEDEYYILAGGALMFHGLREETDNMDLCISTDLFEWLCRTHSVELIEQKNICPTYLIDGQIRCIVKEKRDFDCETISIFPVETLSSILAFKKQRNLPKDVEDIAKIEAHLSERGTLKKS